MTGDAPPDADKRTTLRQFAALGAIGPLASLAGEEGESPPDLDRRDAIRAYVSATPGVHFSKLRDDLDLGTGETQYHVRRLADSGHIESRKDGDYRRLFPAGRFDAFERRTLGYLRRTTPRGMLLRLLATPGITPSEMADELDVSRGAISNWAGELEAAGLLTRDDGRYLVDRPEIPLALLVRYAESFDAETVAFADRAASYLRWHPPGQD